MPLELIHGNVIELPQVTRAFTSSAIKLFVLLDLLGSKQSNTMMNLHSNTTFYYQFLAFLEQLLDHHHPHLDDSFLLNSNETASKKTPFFMNADGFHILVDDDHKPFEMLFPSLKILHLIPVPYPDVWHTIADNKDSLDQQVIYKWQQLLTLFLFYLLTNQE